MLNNLNGSLLAFFIALGFKHNSPWKKTMHGFLCATVFFTCNRFVWMGQIYPSLYVTLSYIITMMTWTFYVRYPLYCTYVKIFSGFNSSQLSTSSKLNKDLVLKPFTPKWKSEFLAEQSRTRTLLLSKWKHILHSQLSPNGLVHIGSTAIRDIALAKPQHDCALAITCDTLPAEFRADLASLGYTYIGVAPHSLDCGDHFFFCIPNAEDKERLGEGYFLHVVTPKVHEWLRTSQIFCEYLSENQVARDSYSNLKRQISNVEKKTGRYTMKKYGLVMRLRKEATIWAANENKSSQISK